MSTSRFVLHLLMTFAWACLVAWSGVVIIAPLLVCVAASLLYRRYSNDMPSKMAILMLSIAIVAIFACIHFAMYSTFELYRLIIIFEYLVLGLCCGVTTIALFALLSQPVCEPDRPG